MENLLEIQILTGEIVVTHVRQMVFDIEKFEDLQRRIETSENSKIKKAYQEIFGSKDNLKYSTENEIKMLIVQLYAFFNVAMVMNM